MSEATERTEEVRDEQGQEEQQEEQQEQEVVEMSKEEYDKALQAEADRRVAQALKKKEQEYKKDLETKTEEVRREAEELAKLSAEERSKVEKEKEEMRLSKDREKLESERKEFESEKLRLQAEKELITRNLPGEFAPYIYGDDADDTMERITVFEEQWQKALQISVDERLRSKTPRLGQSKSGKFTPEQIDSMSADEINANWETISKQMQEGTI